MAVNRRLQHQKAFRTIIGRGIPSPSEGSDGDIQIRTTIAGLKMFVKYGARWWQMGEAAMQIGGRDGSEPISSTSMSGTPTTRIEKDTGNIQLRGNIVLGDRHSGQSTASSAKGGLDSRVINFTGKRNTGLTFQSDDSAYLDNVDIYLESNKKIHFAGDADDQIWIAGSSVNIEATAEQFKITHEDASSPTALE